jgi:hypothetical protein
MEESQIRHSPEINSRALWIPVEVLKTFFPFRGRKWQPKRKLAHSKAPFGRDFILKRS